MRQILFLTGGEKNFKETFQMLQQAYGEDCLSGTQCHEWYQRFKSGRTSIEDDPKSGRPSTSMDDIVHSDILNTLRAVTHVGRITRSCRGIFEGS